MAIDVRPLAGRFEGEGLGYPRKKHPDLWVMGSFEEGETVLGTRTDRFGATGQRLLERAPANTPFVSSVPFVVFPLFSPPWLLQRPYPLTGLRGRGTIGP